MREICPARIATKGRWRTVYENSLPVRMVWIDDSPKRPHVLERLLHGYTRCRYCHEVFAPEKDLTH